MTPAERRAELCGLLALGLVRLRMRGSRANYLTTTGESSPTLSARPMPSCNSNSPEKRMNKPDPIPARLAALKTTPTPDLKAAVARPVRQRAAAVQPPLPRKPAGLPHPGTRLWRAEARDDPAAGAAGRGTRRRRPEEEPHPRRPRPPIAGTRLLREWQGVEQVVTVTADGFEWQGRPYKSLSAIARAITGTRWNGWVFFGLKNHRGRT